MVAVEEIKCPQCDRKFKNKLNLGRHLQASHGSKAKRKKARAKSEERIAGLKFLENKSPSEVLNVMSDALAALRVLFEERETEVKILRRDAAEFAKTMQQIQAFNESLKKQKRLGEQM